MACVTQVYACTKVGCFQSCWQKHNAGDRLWPTLRCTQCPLNEQTDSAVHVDLLAPHQRRYTHWANANALEGDEDVIKYEREVY